MISWPHVRLSLRLMLAVAAIYTGGVFLTRYLSHRRAAPTIDRAQSSRNAAFLNTYGGSAVKILQFYAREGDLTQGSPTVVCYGVLNARKVSIDPPVEGVSPALNRCVETAPVHDTRYTLTAEGDDGRTVSASFVLAVHADAATMPAITAFRVTGRKPEGGRTVYLLSFADRNGEEVSIDPPVFPTLHGAPNGQFAVAPERTTTYTLTVTGKFGHKATRTLTLEVPPR